MEKTLRVALALGGPVAGPPKSQPQRRIEADIPKLCPFGLLVSKFCGAGIDICLFDGNIIADRVLNAAPEIPFILSGGV